MPETQTHTVAPANIARNTLHRKALPMSETERLTLRLDAINRDWLAAELDHDCLTPEVSDLWDRVTDQLRKESNRELETLIAQLQG